jgi:hypothetical protein
MMQKLRIQLTVLMLFIITVGFSQLSFRESSSYEFIIFQNDSTIVDTIYVTDIVLSNNKLYYLDDELLLCRIGYYKYEEEKRILVSKKWVSIKGRDCYPNIMIKLSKTHVEITHKQRNEKPFIISYRKLFCILGRFSTIKLPDRFRDECDDGWW